MNTNVTIISTIIAALKNAWELISGIFKKVRKKKSLVPSPVLSTVPECIKPAPGSEYSVFQFSEHTVTQTTKTYTVYKSHDSNKSESDKDHD